MNESSCIFCNALRQYDYYFYTVITTSADLYKANVRRNEILNKSHCRGCTRYYNLSTLPVCERYVYAFGVVHVRPIFFYTKKCRTRSVLLIKRIIHLPSKLGFILLFTIHQKALH